MATITGNRAEGGRIFEIEYSPKPTLEPDVRKRSSFFYAALRAAEVRGDVPQTGVVEQNRAYIQKLETVVGEMLYRLYKKGVFEGYDVLSILSFPDRCNAEIVEVP